MKKLVDYAKEKGYQVSVDNPTQMVSVVNPITKKRISFVNGKGQEYGMGGLEAGYNTIGDTTKFDSALTDAPKTSFDKAVANSSSGLFDIIGGKKPSYDSPYQAKIDESINLLSDYKPFDFTSYDPNKDPGFVQFRDTALKAGEKAYSSGIASRAIPGVASTSMGMKVAQSAQDAYTNRIQDAIPEFQNRAADEYGNTFNRKLQAANLMIGQDNTGYNRNMDAYNADQSNRDYYTDVTGYAPIDTSTIGTDDPLRKIPDYAAEINKRKAVDPNDPMIPVLNALREEKIRNNPELFKLYGNTLTGNLGIKTAGTRASEAAGTAAAEETAFDRAIKRGQLDIQNRAQTLDEKRFNTAQSNTVSDYNDWFQGFTESADKGQFMEIYGSYMSPDTYQKLSKAASGSTYSPEDAFAQATADQKLRYNFLYDDYLGKGKYEGNPEAAMKQLITEPMNEQLLGPLYNYLKQEIQGAVDAKSKGEKTTQEDQKQKDEDQKQKDMVKQYNDIMSAPDPEEKMKEMRSQGIQISPDVSNWVYRELNNK
jgi:hypothetical protein